MGEVTIRHDIGDDLSDLNLTQARMVAALDDSPVLSPGPPRYVVVVDATVSVGEYLPHRKVTLEAAREIVRPLFEVSGTQVRVLYFRGPNECQASKWFTDSEQAARTIAGIQHESGWTQHGKAFRHIIGAAKKQPIHAAVVLTDAVELRGPTNEGGDVWDDLCKDAIRLKRLGCRITFLYKGTIAGGCPIDRAGPHAEQRIRELAADNEGAVILYNPANSEFAKQLAEVAVEAGLRAKGDATGAGRLIEHLRAVPFQLDAVGDQVLVGKCET
jgi:hypothetical protein